MRLQGSDEPPSTQPAAADDAQTETETWEGIPAWEYHLSRRAKLGRAAAIALAVLLALLVAVGGPAVVLATLSGAWQQVTSTLFPPHPPVPPPTLSGSSWARAALPAGASSASNLELQTVAGDAQVAYLCWTTAAAGPAGPIVRLFRTTDSGQSWAALPVPHAQAARCIPAPDAADPARLALLLYPGTYGTCTTPAIISTTDAGAHWSPVPLPQALLAAPIVCDVSLYSLGDQLLAWSPNAQIYAATAGAAAQLFSTQDDGATWQLAFPQASAGATATFVAAHAGGMLLVLLDPPAGQTAAPTLWCGAAGSARWTALGGLPAGASRVYVANDPSQPAGCYWGNVYAATVGTNTTTGNPPASRIQLRRGSGWAVLPPIPIAGNTPRILGVGPHGALLTGVDLPSESRGQVYVIPQRDIWAWDPAARTWRLDPYVQPGNSTLASFAWNYSQSAAQPSLVIWLYSVHAGIVTFNSVYRAAFPPALAVARTGPAVAVSHGSQGPQPAVPVARLARRGCYTA